jgi:hypothetical protein
MLIKFEEDDKNKITETVEIPNIDIDEISIEAGKMEAELEKEKYVPTEEDLKKLKTYLESIQKDKFGEEQPPIITDEFEPEVKEPYYTTQEEEEELQRLVGLQPELPEENPNVPKINRLSYLRRDG